MKCQTLADTLELPLSSIGPLELIQLIRQGIPKKTVPSLANCLRISTNELAHYLGISERTLQRYGSEKRLSAEVSDHIMQIANVYVRCLEVFEDPQDASRWLKQPNIALGQISPIELMDTSVGIEMVLDELTRIEYGVVA